MALALKRHERLVRRVNPGECFEEVHGRLLDLRVVVKETSQA